MFSVLAGACGTFFFFCFGGWVRVSVRVSIRVRIRVSTERVFFPSVLGGEYGTFYFPVLARKYGDFVLFVCLFVFFCSSR